MANPSDAIGYIPIIKMPAKGDKFARAQDVAGAWNKGRVCVPNDAEWLDAFLSEVATFTGVSDDHDDQVDALAAAYVPAAAVPLVAPSRSLPAGYVP